MVRTVFCLLAALLACVDLCAAAKAAPPATQPATQPAADVPSLIRQLGDDDFHIRLDAARQLKTLGKAALPALLDARKSQDPEVHARVEDILAELNRPPVDDSAVPQAARGAVGMQSISLRTTGLARTLDVVQAGRTIHLEDRPGTIYLKVTGLLDGKLVTREYTAKSADQLKKEHPNAFDLYQQFIITSTGVRMRVGPANK